MVNYISGTDCSVVLTTHEVAEVASEIARFPSLIVEKDEFTHSLVSGLCTRLCTPYIMALRGLYSDYLNTS